MSYRASVAYLTEVDESPHLEGKCAEIETMAAVGQMVEATCDVLTAVIVDMKTGLAAQTCVATASDSMLNNVQ